MTEISAILIFLAGGIIGFVICRITMGTKPTAAQQQKLDDSKAELDHYKSKVNNHFTSSAELMQQVASSYQALYSHMAGQSQVLLSERDAETLPFAQLNASSEEKQEAALLEKDAVQETEGEATHSVIQTHTSEEADETAQKMQENPTPDEPETDNTEENKETAAKEATQKTAADTTQDAAQTDATTETDEEEKAPKNNPAESTVQDKQ